MPAHKSAVKRHRQSIKRERRNHAAKSALRSLRKDFLALFPDKTDEAKKRLPDLQSALDKAAKSGIIHRRTAGRLKSRAAARLS